MTDTELPTTRVIRAPQAFAQQIQPAFQQPALRVIRARVLDELAEIEVSLQQAQAYAEQIRAEALQRGEDAIAQARDTGRAEGYAEVLQDIARARQLYAQTMDTAEADMVEMAFRLAARIVGDTLARDPARVQAMVAAVLRRARGKRDILVKVAPQDLQMLEASGEVLSQQVDGVAVYFEADDTLTRGGCVIHTESGQIDGRIETQLDIMRRALRGGQ